MSTTPIRNKLFGPGRHRSLSLEESGVNDEATYGLNVTSPSDNEQAAKPQRRRLNTYFSSKDHRSLEEAADEDGAFAESISGASVPTGTQAQNLIARSEVAFVSFLQRHPCYELMPHSSKLVVFDTRLAGRKAFFAMMHNGVSAALLWSSEKQTYVGVLTVCDFIRAICHQHTDGVQMLEEQCIESWLQYDSGRKMVVIGPEESLAKATALLLNSRIRRLPVCDPASGNILFTIAHKHIARLIYANLSRMLKPRSWFRTLTEVGMGTFSNIAMAFPESKVIDALQLLISRHVSALPIVSSTNGKLIGIFSRSDSLVLAVDKGYLNLDRRLCDILPHLSEENSTVHVKTCTLEETVGTVIERLVRGSVHRLIVVDASRKVIGIVSLSDLLKFFLKVPSHLQIPGGVSGVVVGSVTSNTLSSTPSLELLGTSQSMFTTGPSCLSFGSSNSSLTAASVTSSTRQHHSSIRSTDVPFEMINGELNDTSSTSVSASLPPCPGPARQMAFAEISS